MLGFGGQTALNCGVALDTEGILNKYGINVLGTQIDGIRITEDLWSGLRNRRDIE
jgi:carbamoyl-phosphate synthase large subunit